MNFCETERQGRQAGRQGGQACLSASHQFRYTDVRQRDRPGSRAGLPLSLTEIDKLDQLDLEAGKLLRCRHAGKAARQGGQAWQQGLAHGLRVLQHMSA